MSAATLAASLKPAEVTLAEMQANAYGSAVARLKDAVDGAVRRGEQVALVRSVQMPLLEAELTALRYRFTHDSGVYKVDWSNPLPVPAPPPAPAPEVVMP